MLQICSQIITFCNKDKFALKSFIMKKLLVKVKSSFFLTRMFF